MLIVYLYENKFTYYSYIMFLPVWMDRGIPAMNKGKDWGFALEK